MLLSKGYVETNSGSSLAVSPDGSHIAMVVRAEGKDNIWIRDIGSPEARLLPGTDGALGTPFWSPDNRHIAFFAGGKLKKTDAGGGPVLTLCAAEPGRSGTWSRSDVIVFQAAGADRLLRVPAAGGVPVPATTLETGELAHRFPWLLPDDHQFVYTVISNDSAKSGVYLAGC